VKIAQIAPPWLRIPPDGYGGVEAVVGTLTDGLVGRGHEVTLFAAPDSPTKAHLRSQYDRSLGTAAQLENPLMAVPHVLGAYRRADEFDVIHDHTFPIGPALGAVLTQPPVVHTIHGRPGSRSAADTYGLVKDRVALVAVSDYQRRSRPDLRFAATIHNGIPIASYPMASSKADYLLFVGRMSRVKGVHLAIEAASRLGRRLVIAAKMTDPVEFTYFAEQVQPLMTESITFLGEVNFRTKVQLFQNAVCSLAPLQYDEPFGLVLVESLACGTPVVAMRRGAAIEIIDHGATGYLAADFDEFVGSIEPATKLDPTACRQSVEARFTADRMVDSYERLFRSIAT
jgi:glycosyltransferase involved in cell wall biosynthesis